MSHRQHLPQLDGELFLTDGGLETSLIFHQGLDLPEFAAFVLLEDEHGLAALRRYYEPYLALARESGAGFVLEAPTWRASPGWAERLGISAERLDELNRRAIELMEELRDAAGFDAEQVVVSGCIGPEGDGYRPAELLSAFDARDYHSTQIATFADTAADMVTALTMTYADEAIGVAQAARDHDLPVAISFTLETDGRLPDGEELGRAIEEVDEATAAAPAYYMLNCAHPSHFAELLDTDEAWVERIRGLRANASTLSHDELDAADGLDDGDPADLAAHYSALTDRLPYLNVVGGCCGTDHRHVAAIRDAMPGLGSSRSFPPARR
jgi:S-methylmethionine-dependent homocysteine/selenocysteine methylase